MDEQHLAALLADVREGRVHVEDAAVLLRRLPFADLGFARVDHHRALRQGMPEAVYAPGKSPQQCTAIVAELLRNGDGPVLLSRASAAQVHAVRTSTSGDGLDATGPPIVTPTVAGTATVVWRPAPVRPERVVIASAGTADLPVVDECIATLHAHGVQVEALFDCGVAGIHRLLGHVDQIASADVVVAVAGMEGALASVIGGLTSAPVIAVPTSVGYGASLEGVTALLAMLSSCAAGVTVVGIDNGYGAACAAVRVLRRSPAPPSTAPPSPVRTSLPNCNNGVRNAESETS